MPRQNLNKSESKLNPRQLAFVLEYIKTGNAVQSYMTAGYTQNYKTARNNSTVLLAKKGVQEEISRLQKAEFKKNVASGEEVMDFLSRVMRGEVLDQFGIETSVADRIKAAQEIAKRTVDLEIRTSSADPHIEISLDWGRALPGSKLSSNVQIPEESSTQLDGAEDVEFEVVDEK